MKNSMILILLFVSVAAFAQKRYSIPTGISRLGWEGKSVSGGGHDGTLKLLSGFVVLANDGLISRGEFLIDMNSIRAKGASDSTDSGLDEHLKSDDFFSVAKFPTALFTVVKAVNRSSAQTPNRQSIEGLLTIRGVTNSITFLADIKKTGNTATIKADFTIERTRWGITYKAQGFLEGLIKEAKDDLISNDIRVFLNLKLIE